MCRWKDGERQRERLCLQLFSRCINMKQNAGLRIEQNGGKTQRGNKGDDKQ